MLYFANDYSTGAHPELLKALLDTNDEKLPGYGEDRLCERAKEKIRRACGCPEAEIFFLMGGTQTNSVALSALLKGYEGVIAAQTGHISVHEAGAVESGGHKVITLPGREGRLDAGTLKAWLGDFYGDESREHMVFPGAVYISQPTEYGTIYSLGELESLSAVCGEYSLTLYMDGARLGYALASPAADAGLEDIARLCGAFYIGGTKVGALCGEALVFPKGAPEHFFTTVKQKGALPAKGRLLGAQFDALFTDGLFFRIGRHAIEKAERLKKIFSDHGIKTFIDSDTNQQFPILDNEKMSELRKKIDFCFWEKYDENHTVVRFATCWSTTDADLDELDKAL
jgi:threonine aldolase